MFSLLTSSSAYAEHSKIVLPRPTGVYAIGTKALALEDPKRVQFRNPEKKRRWMVQAFYPTDLKEQDHQPYMPGTLSDSRIQGKKIVAYAYPNASISRTGPFPVIFFVPGLHGIRQDYTVLCEELASQGYVVLSLDEPYNANFVKFSDGSSVVITLYDWWKLRGDRDYRYNYYDEAMHYAIDDVRYMIDHLEELNQREFASQLNLDAVGIMGHSFGGNVAHTLGFVHKQIKVVVDIDSKITERAVYGKIGVPENAQRKPVLFIRATKQYQEDVGDQLTKIANADIINFAVEHSAFTDKAYFAKYIKQPSLLSAFWTWLWRTGPLFMFVDMDLGSYTPDAWFTEMRKSIVDWLKVNFR